MFRNTIASWGLTTCSVLNLIPTLQSNILPPSSGLKEHATPVRNQRPFPYLPIPKPSCYSHYWHVIWIRTIRAVIGLSTPNRGFSPKHWVPYDLSILAARISVKVKTSSCNALFLKDSKRPLQQVSLSFTLLTTLPATRPRTAVRFPVWTRDCSRFRSVQTKLGGQPAECEAVRAWS